MDFKSRDNVEFVCMYGYNTTLAQDVNRFKFLRSLPGAYVFVQQYRPIQRGPEPRRNFFFDDKADELIDELIGVCFTQNMKNIIVGSAAYSKRLMNHTLSGAAAYEI